MISRCAMIVCSSILMAGVAHAEHKLLITDLLDKGQLEAEATSGYGFSVYNFSGRAPYTQRGEAVHRATFTDLALDLGVGHDLQVGISLPYIYSDRVRLSYSNPPNTTDHYRTEGWGDITLSAKYRLLGDDKPFTLVAGLDLKLDTANADKEGSGTTDYAPYLAASTVTGNGKLRPYAFYRAIIRNHDAIDTHMLGIGAEYAPYKRLSLVPFIITRFHTSSTSIEAYESFQLGVSNYIQIIRSCYLIPSASYNISSTIRTTGNTINDLRGYSLNLGLYYLFN